MLGFVPNTVIYLSHLYVSETAVLSVLDLVFLRNLFQNKINSTQLLCRFSLHDPARLTLAKQLFSEPWARVASVQAEMFCRLLRVACSLLSVLSFCMCVVCDTIF